MRFLSNLHALYFCCVLATAAESAPPPEGVTVPISQETGTSIAASAFPVALALSAGTLYLSDPRVVLADPARVSLATRFQAFDLAPPSGVAISETGSALVSGVLGYDAGTGEILVHQPRLERLAFDREGDTVDLMRQRVMAFWRQHTASTIRAELPPHPFLLPFGNRITDIRYDGRAINVYLRYQ